MHMELWVLSFTIYNVNNATTTYIPSLLLPMHHVSLNSIKLIILHACSNASSSQTVSFFMETFSIGVREYSNGVGELMFFHFDRIYIDIHI